MNMMKLFYDSKQFPGSLMASVELSQRKQPNLVLPSPFELSLHFLSTFDPFMMNLQIKGNIHTKIMNRKIWVQPKN